MNQRILQDLGPDPWHKAMTPSCLLLKCQAGNCHPSILFNQSKEFIRICKYPFIRHIKYLMTLRFNILCLIEWRE